MDAVRLFRTLLGLAVFLAAAYLFEPSLFGGKLPAELMANETLRNIVGVAGAVCGVLLMIDAIFPKPKPVETEPLFESAPDPWEAAPAPVASPDLPETPPAANEPEAEPAPEPEAVWGAYVEPDEDTVKAAQALVEAEYAEAQAQVEADAETPRPPPAIEAEEPTIEVGRGLPPPPPKPD